MKKIISIAYLGIIVFAIIISCSKSKESEVDPIVGEWILVSILWDDEPGQIDECEQLRIREIYSNGTLTDRWDDAKLPEQCNNWGLAEGLEWRKDPDNLYRLFDPVYSPEEPIAYMSIEGNQLHSWIFTGFENPFVRLSIYERYE